MIAFVLLAVLVFTIPWEKSVVLPGVGTDVSLFRIPISKGEGKDSAKLSNGNLPSVLHDDEAGS